MVDNRLCSTGGIVCVFVSLWSKRSGFSSLLSDYTFDRSG